MILLDILKFTSNFKIKKTFMNEDYEHIKFEFENLF